MQRIGSWFRTGKMLLSAGVVMLALLACAAGMLHLSTALAEGELELVDEHNDFSMVYAATSNMGVASSGPERFDGDPVRFYKTTHDEGYFIYEVPNPATRVFTGFELVTWYTPNSDGVFPGDMSFEVSADHVTYTPLAQVQKTIDEQWTASNWSRIYWTASGLPAGTKYVKIIMGDTTSYPATWPIQVGSTTLRYTLDARTMLEQEIDLAQTLLDNADIGSGPGMHPQAAADAFTAAIALAVSVYNDVNASQSDWETAYYDLAEAREIFVQSVNLMLNWPNEASITATAATLTSIAVSWPHVVEIASHPDTEYEIWVSGEMAAVTSATSYVLVSLKPQMDYAFSIVARSGSDSSAPLGPFALSTEPLDPVPAPDFSQIDPDDFVDEDYLAPLVWINDRRSIPYYFTHFHQVVNAVRLDPPNRGFIDIVVHRNPADNEPYNARVQENQLWMTYFYSRQADWNLYYGMPEVRYRLEAALEHLLSLQNEDGTFSVYGWGDINNLAGATFNIHFLSQSVRLLNEAKALDPNFPSIDPDLYDRVMGAIRLTLEHVLNDQRHWNHGRAYTNQYTMVWSTVMAYLAYAPDEDLLDRMLDRFHESETEFISPAGFYYEANGLDMPYNLSVHLQNLIGEYHYFKDTAYEQDLIDKESVFFDWLSYNLVIEPDGSFFTTNAAPSRRTASVAFDRKDIPLAEKIPIARAFVRTDAEVAAEIAGTKANIAAGGTWPNVQSLPLTGNNAYNPYGVYNRILYNYHPTEAERAAAIGLLPYIASDRFNHQRVDDRSSMAFTYVRRPDYYAVFNAGPGSSAMQAFGLGLLWHPEAGIMLSSQTESTTTVRGWSWGTRHQNNSRVYENGRVMPAYTLDGVAFDPQIGYGDLPDGEIALQYNLAQAGSKTVAFQENGIAVRIEHADPFQERFPLMLLTDDVVDIASGLVTVTRGNVTLEIAFDGTASASIQPVNFTRYQHRLHVLTLSASGELDYTITMTAAEPEESSPQTLGALRALLDEYVASGDLQRPLYQQIVTRLNLWEHHIEQAAKQMEDVRDRLTEPPSGNFVAPAAQAALMEAVQGWMDSWLKVEN